MRQSLKHKKNKATQLVRATTLECNKKIIFRRALKIIIDLYQKKSCNGHKLKTDINL